MKAVDPSILLIGPELHQFTADPAQNPKDSQGRDWMTEFLKANGDLVDVVSFHRYPFPKNASVSTTIDDLRQNAKEWTGIIRYLHGLIRETTGRDIPIAITEFNSHWSKVLGGQASPDSFYNAIWAGDLLGQFITQDVFMANQFVFAGANDQGGLTMISHDGLRPIYYTYQMYKLYGSERVPSSSSDPDVSIYAAKNKDGALTIMVINLADDAKTVPLTIKGVNSPASAQVWLFDKDHNALQQADQSLVNGANIDLPAQSMTLFIIK